MTQSNQTFFTPSSSHPSSKSRSRLKDTSTRELMKQLVAGMKHSLVTEKKLYFCRRPAMITRDAPRCFLNLTYHIWIPQT
jgi:hypothetical protein